MTDYGRSKYAIETLLDRDDEVIVRPGLVYDESGGSVFGLFEKLSRLPILPVISDAACIQPIAVRELAVCLLRIAGMATPAKYYNLGAERPLSMAEAVEAVARRAGRRPPLGVRIPAAPVRWTAGLADRILRISPPLLERIDGMIALQPMETAASLASLDMRLAAFDDRQSGSVA
jgi:dTDP-4-dehydrorhamnose reductase